MKGGNNHTLQLVWRALLLEKLEWLCKYPDKNCDQLMCVNFQNLTGPAVMKTATVLIKHASDYVYSNAPN